MIICNNQILNKLGSFFPKKALDFRKVDRILFYSIKCQRFRIWISFINSINQKSHAFQKEHKSFFFFLKAERNNDLHFPQQKKKNPCYLLCFSLSIFFCILLSILFFLLFHLTHCSQQREKDVRYNTFFVDSYQY